MDQRFLSKGVYILPVILAFLCGITPSNANDAKKPGPSKWENFGEVKFEVQPLKDNQGAKDTYYFVAFENGDALVEVGKGSSSKKGLMLQLHNLALYFGLSPEEAAAPYPPFTMVEYALIPVIVPLSLAFPGGITTVPVSEKKFAVAWEGVSYEGTVRRDSEHLVTYDITAKLPPPDHILHITGSFSELRPPPLADDYSIQGWRIREQVENPRGEKEIDARTLRTLGQVRTIRTGDH